MSANEEVNKLFNEIREIYKMPQGKERLERIGKLVGNVASRHETAMSNTQNPEFASMTYFAGFSVIALMMGAVEDKADAANMMDVVMNVVAMCSMAIAKEEGHGTQEKTEE